MCLILVFIREEIRLTLKDALKHKVRLDRMYNASHTPLYTRRN